VHKSDVENADDNGDSVMHTFAMSHVCGV